MSNFQSKILTFCFCASEHSSEARPHHYLRIDFETIVKILIGRKAPKHIKRRAKATVIFS